MSDFLNKHSVLKDRCFHFQAKKPLTWKNPWIELFSITAPHRNSILLRYKHENKSSPRVMTGKWLLKFKKLTTRLKNKTWAIHKLKTIKRAMNSC
jgi:hypothetical protein